MEKEIPVAGVLPETGLDRFDEISCFGGREMGIEFQQHLPDMVLPDTADERFVGAQHHLAE
jgi:hypothetical protein